MKDSSKKQRIILSTLTYLIIALISLAPVGHRALAQQVTVTAQTDRLSVPLNQTLNLTINITGAASAQQPALPVIDGMQVLGTSRSSQVSIANGQSTVQTLFSYTLQPTKEGTLTIPAITLVADGSPYSTEPINIEVTASTSGSSGSAGGAYPSATSGNEIFIEADVDNPTPRLGEQITYSFRYYRAVNVGSPDYEGPSFAGFWNQEETSQSESSAQVGDIGYRVIELRTILFPTIAGEQTIGPSRLGIPQGFFEPTINLETAPVTVDVQPLPQPAPENFSGSVGQFTLALAVQTESGSSETPLTVEVDEPVTLRATLEGAGNFQTMSDMVLPQVKDWRAFDSTSSTDTQATNGQLVGRRIVEQLIVATKPGSFEIPAMEFVYFDPSADEYKTIQTSPVQVNVQGEVDQAANAQPAPLASAGADGSAVERIDADIRHIKPAPQMLNASASPFTQNPLFWTLWLIPLLFVGADWWLARRKLAQDADPAATRRSRALRAALQQIKAARKSSADSTSSSREIITGYLSDKFNQPVSGLTQRDLAQLLTDQHVAPPLIEQTQDLLALSDMGHYAPTASAETATSDLLADVEKLLRTLEKDIEKSSATPNAMRAHLLLISIFLMWMIPQSALAQSPIEMMEQANQLYEAGQYVDAAAAYEALIVDGIQDGALRFNLGNAYFKQGDIGRSILNYERAIRVTPRDDDVRANLALAQTLLTDQYEGQRGSILGQLANLSSRWLTAGEVAGLALALWFLVALLWILYRRRSATAEQQDSATVYALIAALVLFLFVIGLWGVRSISERTRSQAIIIAQEIDVLSGPGDQYITEFTLHSGSKVSVLESRGAWHRLALPGDELQGWVPSDAIGLIAE